MEQLKHAEFVKVECDLCLREAVNVDLATLLRLRRSIRAAAQYVLPTGGDVSRFGRLLSPDLPSDPVALRQHQKCGPAFVLQHKRSCLGQFARGDVLTITAVIWGGDSALLHDFILVLQGVGKTGLRYDAGRFDVVSVRAEDSAQYWQRVWTVGNSVVDTTAPVRDAAWWLTSFMVDAPALRIEFTTPARLLVKDRPLFKAKFKQLFPFMLRRVSAMLYSHCQLDLELDAAALIKIADNIEESDSTLQWHDWRELWGGDRQQPLGGVGGSITISGLFVRELLPYVYLASLMNIGKNAAFGAGCYKVVPLSD